MKKDPTQHRLKMEDLDLGRMSRGIKHWMRQYPKMEREILARRKECKEKRKMYQVLVCTMLILNTKISARKVQTWNLVRKSVPKILASHSLKCPVLETTTPMLRKVDPVLNLEKSNNKKYKKHQDQEPMNLETKLEKIGQRPSRWGLLKEPHYLVISQLQICQVQAIMIVTDWNPLGWDRKLSA